MLPFANASMHHAAKFHCARLKEVATFAQESKTSSETTVAGWKLHQVDEMPIGGKMGKHGSEVVLEKRSNELCTRQIIVSFLSIETNVSRDCRKEGMSSGNLFYMF